ncbi:MAG: hypothetical protein ACM3UV_02055, partial [Nocardioidaceae bacterium]
MAPRGPSGDGARRRLLRLVASALLACTIGLTLELSSSSGAPPAAAPGGGFEGAGTRRSADPIGGSQSQAPELPVASEQPSDPSPQEPAGGVAPAP